MICGNIFQKHHSQILSKFPFSAGRGKKKKNSNSINKREKFHPIPIRDVDSERTCDLSLMVSNSVQYFVNSFLIILPLVVWYETIKLIQIHIFN